MSSTIDFVFILAAIVFPGLLRKKKSIACPTIGVKHHSRIATIAKLTWLIFLLCDISLPLPQFPFLFYDNISALHMAKNLVFHAQTKHIELDYHFACEKLLWDTFMLNMFIVIFK